MRATPPTPGACSPNRPRELSLGYSNPRSSGFRRVPPGRGVPARSITGPHDAVTPRLPRHPRSTDVRRVRSKRVRAPEAAPDARHGAAATDRSARAGGYARARGRGGADARAETPSAARLRAAARVPASLHASRGRFRAATFNGLKGPRRRSKRARPGRAAAFFSRRTVFSDTRVFHVFTFTFFLDARNRDKGLPDLTDD